MHRRCARMRIHADTLAVEPADPLHQSHHADIFVFGFEIGPLFDMEFKIGCHFHSPQRLRAAIADAVKRRSEAHAIPIRFGEHLGLRKRTDKGTRPHDGGGKA